MRQFEYKEILSSEHTNSMLRLAELNNLGKLGWEVCAVIDSDSALLLKREIPKWIPAPETPISCGKVMVKLSDGIELIGHPQDFIWRKNHGRGIEKFIALEK